MESFIIQIRRKPVNDVSDSKYLLVHCIAKTEDTKKIIPLFSFLSYGYRDFCFRLRLFTRMNFCTLNFLLPLLPTNMCFVSLLSFLHLTWFLSRAEEKTNVFKFSASLHRLAGFWIIFILLLFVSSSVGLSDPSAQIPWLICLA